MSSEKGKGPKNPWNEAAINFYRNQLARDANLDFIPPNILWCLSREAENPATPEDIRKLIADFLVPFDLETGDRKKTLATK